MKNLKERGITLIALVITIIVLLILAGVTLSLIWNGGIIKKSQQAVDTYSEQAAKEQLILAIGTYKFGLLAHDSNMTSLEYALEISGIEDRRVTENANTWNVEVNGYEFVVDKATLQIIESLGPVNGIKPEIKKVAKSHLDTNTNTITITVDAEAKNGGTLTIQVKKEDGTIINPNSGTNNIFTITKNGTYRVIVDENGRKSTQTITIEEIPVIKYRVSVTANTNATIVGGNIDVEQGTSTQIKVTDVEDGYEFKNWKVTSGKESDIDNLNSASIIVTPTQDLSIEAIITLPDMAEVSNDSNHTLEFLDNIYDGVTWGTLVKIANIISKEPTINKDTREVTVRCDGDLYKLRIGDRKGIVFSDGVRGENGSYEVRILGFNHDVLSSDATKKAGISFEFTSCIKDFSIKTSDETTNSGGWVNENSTIGEIYPWLNDSNNGVYLVLQEENEGLEIKQVRKNYLDSSTDTDSSDNISNDYLWLLSCSEIWKNGHDKNSPYGMSRGKEGEQYCFWNRYTGASLDSTWADKCDDGFLGWWLRSPVYYNDKSFCCILFSGLKYGQDQFDKVGISPGFCI